MGNILSGIAKAAGAPLSVFALGCVRTVAEAAVFAVIGKYSMRATENIILTEHDRATQKAMAEIREEMSNHPQDKDETE